jgi:hypothetical protein
MQFIASLRNAAIASAAGGMLIGLLFGLQLGPPVAAVGVGLSAGLLFLLLLSVAAGAERTGRRLRERAAREGRWTRVDAWLCTLGSFALGCCATSLLILVLAVDSTRPPVEVAAACIFAISLLTQGVLVCMIRGMRGA